MTLPAERVVTRAFDRFCYFAYMRVPYCLQNKRLALWLLERAGRHAYGEAE